MGKGTNTTTTTSSANPAAMSAYYDLLNRAQGVASQPYQPYTGELVAPVNAQQQTGIGAINQNAGFALPYIQQAGQNATQAAQPLSAQQIQQYQSPHTQSVVDATTNWMNQQNKQQQQNVLGNAAAQGALGGDRVGVAQANLASQQTASQAPIIAGLYNQGYSQALQTAQQQQANLANSAYSLGNLGVAGQNAALSGANAQIGAGNLLQGNEQARLSALYDQYKIAQAFPYQQAQWLAGITTGVGSQMGGTSSTETPKPSPWGQIIGGGLAAASMFLRDGGRIKGFAAGGDTGVSDMPYAGVGWIPARQIVMGRGAPPPPQAASQASAAASPSGMPSFKRRGVGEDSPLSISPVGGFEPSPVGTVFGYTPTMPSGLGPLYNCGGGIRGYDDGGVVGEEEPVAGFADRWAPAYDAIQTGVFDPQGANSMSGIPAPQMVSDAGLVPMPRERPMDAPQVAGFAPSGLPPQITGAPDDGELPDGVLAYGPGPMVTVPDKERGPVAGFGPTEAAAEPAQRRFGLGLIPEQIRMPLLTAGLSMMASRSPHLLSAIGEGGLAGVGAYSQQQQREFERAEKKEARAIQTRRVDLEAKRLQQMADQFRQTHGLGERRHFETVRHAKEQEGIRREQLERGKFTYLGPNADGTKSVFLNQVTGDLEERDTKIAPKPTEKKDKVIPGSVLKDLGEKGQSYSTLTTLNETFKPGYAGWKSDTVADVMNEAARRGLPSASSQEAAAWWQDYDRYKAVVRNKLFGSALTAAEIAQWNKFDAKPSQSPEAVKKNIAEQRKIVEQGLRRRADSLAKQGYPKDAIEAEIGLSLPNAADGKLSDKDRQALEWANANPTDPRSAAIKKRLGVP